MATHDSEEGDKSLAAQAEMKHLHFLLKLSDALRPLSDPVAVHETVTCLAMNHFETDRCYYSEVENEVAIIRRDASRPGLPSVAGTYPLVNFPLFLQALKYGRPTVINDIPSTTLIDENLKEQCVQVFRIFSYVCVPVIKNGRPVGILFLTQCQSRSWTNMDIELAEEVAERVWGAVERAKAEKELQLSEKKYRQLFETMDEGFAIGELIRDSDGIVRDYQFLELNPAVQRQTGMDREFFLGKPLGKVVPDVAPWWRTKFEEVISTGEISRFEHYVNPLKRWFDVTAFALEGDRFAVLYDDITDRKQRDLDLEEFQQQLEEQVEKRTRELQEEHFFLEQITDNMPHLIYVYDFDEQRFIYINRRIQALTGITTDYVYGMGEHLFKKILHPDDLARRISYTLRLETLSDGEIRENEFRIRVGEGYRWFRSKDQIFKKTGNKVKQVIGLAEDVTYEILLQEKMQSGSGEVRLN